MHFHRYVSADVTIIMSFYQHELSKRSFPPDVKSLVSISSALLAYRGVLIWHQILKGQLCFFVRLQTSVAEPGWSLSIIIDCLFWSRVKFLHKVL